MGTKTFFSASFNVEVHVILLNDNVIVWSTVCQFVRGLMTDLF